ncbi:unnamed protein product [Linum tenue]|nr:unnamed protein product [Linum tenue]
MASEINNEETVVSDPQPSIERCEAQDGKTTDVLEKGLMEHGCSHYRRRCSVRAPCCNEVFSCRHCHNEAKNDIKVDQKLRHDMPRHEVRQVVCSLCATEQEVQQVCRNCGVCMGKYYCETCKFFDDDISRGQFHCDACGICRIGGRENFFHCKNCGSCYPISIKKSHTCVEGSMRHDCPVCFEYLFESRRVTTVLPCGHTIHQGCLSEMLQHNQLSITWPYRCSKYACPLCSKSVCDMSATWEALDVEIAATPMPEPYRGKMVCFRTLFGYSATIAAKPHKYSSISLVISAPIASPTTLAKQKTERSESWLVIYLPSCSNFTGPEP